MTSIPLSVGLHKLDIFARMRVMGVGGPVETRPLKDEAAIALAAEIIGEAFVFSVGAGIIALEYWRQQRKETAKEETQDSQLKALQNRVELLSGKLRNTDQQINELKNRLKNAEKELINKNKQVQ